ncbi:MAG: FAD-dependent oxidoreductase [Candidatus Omnitrophica bacterium]|nr:FAD-dependent oxidoreductase [Candidatus Omnitrophota bacterium]
MKKVIIIGGGFAGLKAAQVLCKRFKNIKTHVIDKNKNSIFLPLLPDVIGREINHKYLEYPLDQAARVHGFNFINREVSGIDLEKKKVICHDKNFDYDFLVIAAGSRTNFYGQEQIKKTAFTLDDTADALAILEALKAKSFENIVICGAGYTGVEIAANIKAFLLKHRIRKKIIIAEKFQGILSGMPGGLRKYVLDKLGQMDIPVSLNTSIRTASETEVVLSDGKVIEKAMLIWAAGVKCADFLSGTNLEKNAQERIKVDRFLCFKEGCFAIGDSALVLRGQKALRMSVQFAVTQGASAALNIGRINNAKKEKIYKPVDLGYIIPMAGANACGNILGIQATGAMPALMHYIMCIVRSWETISKLGIIRSLLVN